MEKGIDEKRYKINLPLFDFQNILSESVIFFLWWGNSLSKLLFTQDSCNKWQNRTWPWLGTSRAYVPCLYHVCRTRQQRWQRKQKETDSPLCPGSSLFTPLLCCQPILPYHDASLLVTGKVEGVAGDKSWCSCFLISHCNLSPIPLSHFPPLLWLPGSLQVHGLEGSCTSAGSFEVQLDLGTLCLSPF